MHRPQCVVHNTSKEGEIVLVKKKVNSLGNNFIEISCPVATVTIIIWMK